MKKINLWNFIAPIIIILVTVFVIQFSRGWRYDLVEKTVIPTGILDITSAPRGATILLNGEKVGKTPTVIDSITEGDHLLELRKSGYINWQTQTTVTSGRATKIEANLFEENSELEQLSDTPLEDIVFSQSGNEAIIISKHKNNQGIWKIQLKASFFTIEKTKVKLADLFEPKYFDLLQAKNYNILPSPDFSKLLLSVTTEDGENSSCRSFILNTNRTNIVEITEYLPNDTSSLWSNNSKYLIYKLDNNSLYTLNTTNLQASQITNWETKVWADMQGKIYFVQTNPLTNERFLFSANMNGTNRTPLDLESITPEEVTNLWANPTHEVLITSTDTTTYIYELQDNKLEKIADIRIIPFSKSPNQRFTLLIEEQSKNIYSYDHEFSELALIIENYQIETELLTWAPNDLKLFYRFTDENGQNVIKSLDANGSNKLNLLTLEDYSAKLDDVIGMSADAKELYLPLLSSATTTNEDIKDVEKETSAKTEVILYRLKLR